MKYSIITKKYNFKVRETVEYPVVLPDTDYHPYFRITDGRLKIELFFCWDGSSIPLKGFFKAITFGMYDGDRYCKDASLVHDALCQLINLGFLDREYKEYIDRLYEKMIIAGAKKVIMAQWDVGRGKILDADLSYRKMLNALAALRKKNERLLEKLPAWAARRYWAVKNFGARTLNPRPVKVILST